MTLMPVKVFHNKQNFKVNNYRKYKQFSNEAFMHEVKGTCGGFHKFILEHLK